MESPVRMQECRSREPAAMGERGLGQRNGGRDVGCDLKWA